MLALAKRLDDTNPKTFDMTRYFRVFKSEQGCATIGPSDIAGHVIATSAENLNMSIEGVLAATDFGEGVQMMVCPSTGQLWNPVLQRCYDDADPDHPIILAAGGYLGLSMADARKLFTVQDKNGHYFDRSVRLTPAHAAEAVRNVTETGDPQWRNVCRNAFKKRI